MTLITLCALSLFRKLESLLPAFAYAVHSVVVAIDSETDEQALLSFLNTLGFDVHQMSCASDRGAGTTKYNMTIRTRSRRGLTELNSACARRPEILSYSIVPL